MPKPAARARILLPLALLLHSMPARGQGAPLGAEFRVNTHTTAAQRYPQASRDPGPGQGFVVVWQSFNQDGAAYGIFGQRYGSSGARTGSEFRVNTFTPSIQAFPRLSHAPDGGFVVVWQSQTHTTAPMDAGLGVFGQRYASGGQKAGAEFHVNTYTTESQARPSVGHAPSGAFVVVWESQSQIDVSYGIFAQRFNSLGQRAGPELHVNTFTSDAQARPSVSVDPSGGFVVAWQSNLQDGNLYGVFAQRFNSLGQRLASEFRVNTYATSNQLAPRVSHAASGAFVVAWQSRTQDRAVNGVFAQRFNSLGGKLGAELQVNTYTTADQLSPDLSHDAGGGFVVVWQSFKQDGSAYGVFGQRYDSQGHRTGTEFRINTYTTQYQAHASVSRDLSGSFLVVWESYAFLGTAQDGSGAGVFGRRFQGVVLTPTRTRTATPQPSSTATATQTRTLSPTATSTATDPPTSTVTPTSTGLATETTTPTAPSTSTGLATETTTPTAPPTATGLATDTPTSTATPTATGAAAETATPAVTATATASPLPVEARLGVPRSWLALATLAAAALALQRLTAGRRRP